MITYKQRRSSKLKIVIMIAVLVIIALIGASARYLVKHNDGKRIDFSLDEDYQAERYYGKRMTEILDSENRKLGQPLTALGSDTLDSITANPCTFKRPQPHGTAAACEIGQTAHIKLDSSAAKHKFYVAATELSFQFEQQKWETETSGKELKLNVESPVTSLSLPAFASYVTTQPLPVYYRGQVTSWPLVSYYKMAYYKGIAQKANCSLSMSVEKSKSGQSDSIRLDLSCSAYFDQ